MQSKLSRTLGSVGMLAVSLNGLSSCSKATLSHREGIDPKPEVAAPARIHDALASTRGADLAPGDQDEVVLKKSALEKEFLLSGSYIPQTGAATSHGFTGRIVAFRQLGHRLFLLEATQGHVVSPTLPSTLILTEFPILKETDDAIVMDFNRGMSQVFTTRNWYASDGSGKDYEASTEVTNLRRSFLKSVREVGNSLEIRQIAQASEDGKLNPYELRYYLTPYHPNPNFAPRETSDFTHVGFFEVRPTLETVTGRNIVRISHWDLSQPVTYAVSANTPAEFRDAVKQGVLYWNNVFGREVVRAIDAPVGVTAPDPQYNVIQWVENDSAGSAYADALMDPRSGEILHAQVYLTSVFGTKGKQRISPLSRLLRDTNATVATTLPSEPKSSVFQSSRLCELPLDSSAISTVASLRAQGGVDSAIFLKAAQDYVRNTTAHEIGHTLGMRHNFAGSLGAAASPDDSDRMVADYLLRGILPQGQYFSSSLMEYVVFPEAVLNAAQYQLRKDALPYDRMAIQWAYFGTPIDEKTAPLFCTDSQADKYKDCQTFDQGPKPVVSNMMKLRKAVNLLPMNLVEKYLEIKAPADARDQKPFEKLALNPETLSKELIDVLKDQVSWMKSGGVQSIATERMFPFATPFYKEEMESAQDASVASQVAEAGGIDSVLFSLVPDEKGAPVNLAKKAMEGLNAYLSRQDVREGVGLAGQSYSLTEEEMGVIRRNAAKLFHQIEEKTLPGALEALAKGSYTNPSLAPEIEDRLGKLAASLILTQTDKIVDNTPLPTPAASEDEKTPPPAPIAAKEFAYSKEVRVKAAALLNQSLGKPADWSMIARTKTAKELKENIQKVLGQDPFSVDRTTLPRNVRQWFMDQMEVLATLVASANH